MQSARAKITLAPEFSWLSSRSAKLKNPRLSICWASRGKSCANSRWQPASQNIAASSFITRSTPSASAIFPGISNLPAAWREHIASIAEISLPRIVRRFQSTDGSVRYLLEINSGGAPSAQIEAVFMPDPERWKSPDNLHIDASRLRGGLPFLPHSPVRTAAKFIRRRNCWANSGCAKRSARKSFIANECGSDGPGRTAAQLRSCDGGAADHAGFYGLALGPRHVTLSTSGIVPGIERLAEEPVRPRLAISLNASNDAQRDAIMPINRKYPLAVLLELAGDIPCVLGNT